MRVNFFAFLLSSQFRIKHVPQAIPEQIDAEYSDKDRQPRKNSEPGSAVHITSALVEHRAPGWDAGRDAEAEKTQADRKSTRLNSSHPSLSRMPSSA